MHEHYTGIVDMEARTMISMICQHVLPACDAGGMPELKAELTTAVEMLKADLEQIEERIKGDGGKGYEMAEEGARMSTAMWMNERITTENKKFPPEKQELPVGSPPRKTHRDANPFPAHGAKAEEEWLANRRRELWNNKSFERTVASNRLSNIKSTIIKSTPHLRDPRRAQEEIDACMKERVPKMVYLKVHSELLVTYRQRSKRRKMLIISKSLAGRRVRRLHLWSVCKDSRNSLEHSIA